MQTGPQDPFSVLAGGGAGPKAGASLGACLGDLLEGAEVSFAKADGSRRARTRPHPILNCCSMRSHVHIMSTLYAKKEVGRE